MTGEASAHAQHKFGAVKADFVAYNKLTTGLRHDLGLGRSQMEQPIKKNKLRQNFAKVAKILLLSQKYSKTNPANL